MTKRAVAALPLAALLASCTLGPDYRRPDVQPPGSYRDAKPSTESLANLEWWDLFQDPALRDLVRAGLEGNKNLQAAYWRVEEARARLGFTKADLWPRFDYRLGASVADPSDATPPLPGDRSENYVAAAGVSWEIDLWGRLRRSNEAARAELMASEWGRRAITLSLVAEVARLYFLLRDFDARLQISRSTLDSRHGSTELIRERFRGGIVSELDVRQAEIQEQVAAAAVPFFERQVAQVENALSVLVGRDPGDVVRGRTLQQQPYPMETPAGLPSELLERRPDIRESEERLHAQMARIGVAQALRFPQLTLTGALGVESGELSDLTSGDARFWNLGLDLFGPIFEFGKNKRRVEIERARAEEEILRYEDTILGAFREVADALVAIRTLSAEHQARVDQVASAEKAAYLSRERYDGGVTSYLEVLDSERSLFDSELQASATLQEHLNAIVALYAALGGGWHDEPDFIPQPQVPGNERQER